MMYRRGYDVIQRYLASTDEPTADGVLDALEFEGLYVEFEPGPSWD